MAVPKLNCRAILLRAALIDDGLQRKPGPRQAWGAPLWVAVLPAAAGEDLAAGRIVAFAQARILLRDNAQAQAVRASDWLRLQGRDYAITAIGPADRPGFLEISAHWRADA